MYQSSFALHPHCRLCMTIGEASECSAFILAQIALPSLEEADSAECALPLFQGILNAA